MSSRIGAITLLACAELMAAQALEMASGTLAAKLLWRNMGFLGISLATAHWFVYTLWRTGRESLVTRRTGVALSVSLVVLVTMIFTNEIHGLVWQDVRIGSGGRLSLLEVNYGPGYWLFITHTYGLLLLACYLNVQMLIRSRRLYRWQATALLFGATVPGAVSLFDVARVSPLPGLTMTALGIGGLTVAWTFYRVKRGDVLAVSRSAIVSGMTDGVIVVDGENRIVDLNPTAQRLLELPGSETVGAPLGDVWPALAAELIEHDGEAQTTGEVTLKRQRAARTYDWSTSVVTDWRDRLVSKIIVLRDISERKRAQAEMERLKEFNENIVQSVTEGISLVDTEGRLSFVNPALLALLGYDSASELIGKPWSAIVPPDQHAVVRASDDRRVRGEVDRYELELVRKDGTRVLVLVSGCPRFDGDQFVGTIGTLTDITERVRAEETVKASLHEKEVLLKEIHHRVKNNLQVISSLLYLQSKKTSSQECLKVLQESNNRVHSMALVHERLYRSRDLAKVDLSEYLRDLTSYLLRSYVADSHRVTVQVNVDGTRLDIDTAIPCGLIINE